MQNKVHIYYAVMPKKVSVLPLESKRRNDYIDTCLSQKTKEERYCVWKLLEYALKDISDKPIKEYDFTQNKNGKWWCEDINFSLTHSGDIVAIAISNERVGIDVQEEKRVNTLALAKKILTEKELQELDSAKDKNAFLLQKWAQKECVYKMLENNAPFTQIQTSNYILDNKVVVIDSQKYFVVTSCEKPLEFEYHIATL